MRTEARATLQHTGSTGEAKELAGLRSLANGALLVRTRKITFGLRFCADPTGMEEAVVCSSQRPSDGRSGRVGVLQK